MTPFGERVRQLRRARGISQKEMAAALDVSAAYLSALEHGHRGAPNWAMVQKIIGYFNVIWDEADELQRLAEFSRPRVIVDTAGLSEDATEFANLLAQNISVLEENDVAVLSRELRRILANRLKIQGGS